MEGVSFEKAIELLTAHVKEISDAEEVALIEPLEYKDVKRIREFVIAIDTSGSVAGSPALLFCFYDKSSRAERVLHERMVENSSSKSEIIHFPSSFERVN